MWLTLTKLDNGKNAIIQWKHITHIAQYTWDYYTIAVYAGQSQYNLSYDNKEAYQKARQKIISNKNKDIIIEWQLKFE